MAPELTPKQPEWRIESILKANGDLTSIVVESLFLQPCIMSSTDNLTVYVPELM